MPYNDANEFAILGGAPARDILDSTPGFAGPLQSGADALRQSGASLGERYDAWTAANRQAARDFDSNALGGSLQKAAKDAKGPSGIERFLTRGVYLLVGSILLVFGLVMLSRPAREGIVEGVAQGIREGMAD